jgi:hypothetical protein
MPSLFASFETSRRHSRRRVVNLCLITAVTVLALNATGLQARAAAHPAAGSACAAPTGRYQQQVEGYLGLSADGKQSPQDCQAIRAYQQSHTIVPADGSAGAVTYTVAYWEWSLDHPAALSGCDAGSDLTACVDLSHQIMWVQSGERTVFGPVPVRSGRVGAATRTGWFRIFRRDLNHISSLYHSPMPFSQFFSNGQAFHGILGDLYQQPGSYGCINMHYDEAQQLWSVLADGSRAHIWGSKPIS